MSLYYFCMFLLIVQEVYYLFKKVYSLSTNIVTIPWEVKIGWQGNL